MSAIKTSPCSNSSVQTLPTPEGGIVLMESDTFAVNIGLLALVCIGNGRGQWSCRNGTPGTASVVSSRSRGSGVRCALTVTLASGQSLRLNGFCAAPDNAKVRLRGSKLI